MTKQHFIELADVIRKPGMMPASIDRALSKAGFAGTERLRQDLTREILASVTEELADFCKSQNPAFDRERWLGYIAGTNGPSGGKR